MSRVEAVTVFSNRGDAPVHEDHIEVNPERGIFVLADGFGGPSPGAQTARLACQAIVEFLEREAEDGDATMPFVLKNHYSLTGNILFNALLYANLKVAERNHGKGIYEKGGASVVAGFTDGNVLALANIGACSAWLYRNGRAARVCTPQSYGRFEDPSSVDDETSPGAAVPLMALGINAELEPEIVEFKIQKQDWLVLHTSGAGLKHHSQLAGIQKQGFSQREVTQKAQSLFEAGTYIRNSTLCLGTF